MSDKLVFDLAQEVEGTPNVFVRKDWINILDNQNQNYNNNQSVIDTSQLSNSNKYMSYREAYFSVPFLLTLGTTAVTSAGTAPTNQFFTPLTSTRSADYSIGLKNWFGQIIHSFTLDYNGTTIIQQTPYVNMWNSFKLMTSLSMADVHTQGCTIGFYPDDPLSWVYADGTFNNTINGQGVSNNSNAIENTLVNGNFNNFRSGRGNNGFLKRQQYINFDGSASTGVVSQLNTQGATYDSMLYGGATGACVQVWKSFVQNKINQTAGNAIPGMYQVAVVATIYLKHIHSFFNMCPLLKGVFMKMTMNLNNTTTAFIASSAYNAVATAIVPSNLTCTSVSNALGGVNPIMIASGSYSDSPLFNQVGTSYSEVNGGFPLFPSGGGTTPITDVSSISYRLNISVGAVCLDSILSSSLGIQQGKLSRSIYLYIPAYTFNPVFEQAYLSSPVKQIKYTDIYQYQVLNVAAQANFNNLLTNGIANIKSVLILPFYSATGGSPVLPSGTNSVTINNNTGFVNGVPVWQSPFDTAGTGTTSPCCWISNFNIQVSGQNAIYNLEKYNFEQFNNQLYGQNAVNGGLTDGLTSGLIDRQAFDMNYCYYYINVERMLPVEQSVPKSIQVLGQNYSSKALDLYCFIEYGVDISIDSLTGARV